MKALVALGSITAALAGETCPWSECSAGGTAGVCVDVSKGCCHGSTTSGLCPGDSNILCCTGNPCSTPQGDGICQEVGTCSGVSLAGYCSGPSDLQCCIDDSSVTFGENPYYYDHWCNDVTNALVYLDDKYCQKKFPTNFDREFSCPIDYDLNHLDGYQENVPLSEANIDTTLLPSILSVNANICIIMTRRSSGKVYNKYFCNGEDSFSPYETWSSSKIFAMANAADTLRKEESCASEQFGLDSSTTGKHGKTPLGDLSTIICSYDTTQGYSSNSLSSYFHDLGWRERAYKMVTEWLGQGTNSLGGNYGENTPSDLSFDILNAEGELCSVEPDPWSSVYSNSLSALSAAELTRRIAQYREVPESMKFPNSTFADMKNILYGAEKSELFAGTKWGGMTADTSIFLQSALNISDVQLHSNGFWRIFSKLGAGYSTSRLVGEITNNAYACLPVLESGDAAKANSGVEFTLSVRGSVPGDTSLSSVEDLVHIAVNEVIGAVLAGKIQ